MIKMIILLMLCLPLIIMLCLFTTTSVVSIAVDIPVGGIEIVSDDIVELDLDRGDSFTVEYTISPTEASNTSITFSFEEIPGEKLAEFSVDGSTITPTSSGSAKVIVETVDGGYRDSFIVMVYTNGVESIVSTPGSSVITVGETTEITTVYSPARPNDESLTYRVKDGEGIVTVSNSGKIHGIGLGTAVIEVTSVDNPDAKSEFTVEVVSSGVIDFAKDTIYLTSLDICNSSVQQIQAVLNPEKVIEGYSIRLLDQKNGAELPADIVLAELDLDTGAVVFTFIDASHIGTVEAEITLTTADSQTVTKSCYVTCISEIIVDWADDVESSIDLDSTRSEGEDIGIDLKPLGAKVVYGVTLVYNSNKDTVGEITSGVSFTMEEGHRYVCNGGYVSIELDVTATGVFLIVRGECTPGLEEISSNATVTDIYLTVYDPNSEKTVTLDKISVVLY